MMKFLVTGSLGADENDIRAIEALGHEVTLHPDERVPAEHPEQYEGMIGNSLLYYTGHEGYTSLRYLQITSAGLDRIPLDWVRERGIKLCNAEGVYSGPMAEWTVMRILELLRRVPQNFRMQLAGEYKRDFKWQELAGKKVFLAGFGAYGREIARRLKPFGVTLTVFNRSRKEDSNVDEFLPLSELKARLPEADILVLAVALTGETRHLIDTDAFARMKRGALLVNASRGPVVDEAALVTALTDGTLAGAALDVFETEPLPADSPLWKLENVLLSAHNSYFGNNNHRRMMELVLKNLREYGE
ncbi:MAG: hypothetical protein IKR43_06550 [Lachnospiraceae bacterium]|nr:hypothetical protein [Lachnospiraceae bacterium]